MTNKSELEKAKASDKRLIRELLSKAKKEVEAADQIMATADENANRHYREAAECIAKAQENKVSQRQIADAIGKSSAWVNRLLRWHKEGDGGSPFAVQSKEARERKKERSVATEHGQESLAAEDDDSQGAAEYADNDTDDEELSDTVITSDDRDRLLKLLRLIGSDQDGECLNAARKVESLREKIGVAWDDLIIPAETPQARAA